MFRTPVQQAGSGHPEKGKAKGLLVLCSVAFQLEKIVELCSSAGQVQNLSGLLDSVKSVTLKSKVENVVFITVCYLQVNEICLPKHVCSGHFSSSDCVCISKLACPKK